MAVAESSSMDSTRMLSYTTATGEERMLVPVVECGELYSYTVPSFSVLHVNIRRIKYETILSDGTTTMIVDGFIRDDPSLLRTYPVELSVGCDNTKDFCIIQVCYSA